MAYQAISDWHRNRDAAADMIRIRAIIFSKNRRELFADSPSTFRIIAILTKLAKPADNDDGDDAIDDTHLQFVNEKKLDD